MNEFYIVYRQIEFKQEQRKLLDYIVSTINSSLEHVSKEMDVKSSIYIENMRTVEELEELKNGLIAGEVDLKTAVKLIIS